MELVYKLAKEVQKEDGILYLVGGCVRDKFLGLESQDIDIEIFGIEASTFESILSKYTKWKKVGKYEIYLLRNKKQIHLQKFLLIYNESKKTLKPIIKGKDLIILGFKTNVNFGEVLKELHILQLKDENLKKEDLINYAKSILSNRQI